MLTAAPTKKYSHSQFFHEISVCTRCRILVNPSRDTRSQNEFHIIQRCGFPIVRPTDDFDHVTGMQLHVFRHVPSRSVSIHPVRRKMIIRGPRTNRAVIHKQLEMRDAIVLIKILHSDVVCSGWARELRTRRAGILRACDSASRR